MVDYLLNIMKMESKRKKKFMRIAVTLQLLKNQRIELEEQVIDSSN